MSFPGEHRDFVEAVAECLRESLGKGKVFYDKHFEAELALPDLDIYIQDIYHDHSDLIAVFLCAEYEKKEWCGLEWRAIRDLIKKRQDSDIMLLRFDDTEIKGLFSIDGYVDIAGRSSEEIAALILERVGTTEGLDTKIAGSAPPKRAVRCWLSPQWPDTDPNVFGREDELALLDAAWDEGKLSIVTLAAAGGVGKTALMNRWINYRMQPENWRGAARVFGWSFYSQGAEEGRQSSADIFIDRALRWFGDDALADTPTPPYDKGHRLAELVSEQRTLLLLDGVEPLQEAPGAEAQHPGRLKDPGLQGLLRGLALNNPGLCVVSTRIEVADLKPYAAGGGSVLSKDLDDLAPEAGAEFLKSLGVTGSDDEMRKASEEFGNHALALTLLGGFLVRYRQNDVKKRDTVPDIFGDPQEGGHAKRVMKWYAKEFKGKAEGQVLRILGLFDRPVEPGALKVLLSGEAINGLTTRLNGVSAEVWIDVITTLQKLRLIAGNAPPPMRDDKPDEALDCHPLVRAYFGDRLGSEQPNSWKAAHNRLFEYYYNLPPKDLPDTIQEMAHLFQAVVHGCRAGRYVQALDEVYCRRIQHGQNFYATKKLGAFGAILSATASFYDPPWRSPVKDLSEADRGFILNDTGFSLSAVGRLAEAIEPLKAGLAIPLSNGDWKNAAISAGNLCKLLLTLGRVEEAHGYADQAKRYADESRSIVEQMAARAALASALHKAGRLQEAIDALNEVEAMQRELEPEHRILYSVQGFWYCTLILAQGDAAEAQRRAQETLNLVLPQNWLLDIALDYLTLGCAGLSLGLAVNGGDLTEAGEQLGEAVGTLRKAGYQDELPRGLLSRAKYYRVCGEFTRGQRDLEEVWATSTRSGMLLFVCDVHLECARALEAMASAGVAMDKSELLPDSPFLQFLEDDDGDWRETALRAARGHIEVAARMVEETGYHLRDPEIPLETARVEALAGNVKLGRQQLEKAKHLIEEMGCHCWDRDAAEIGEMLNIENLRGLPNRSL